MSLPNRKQMEWSIEEQIIEDPVSGLTFQFEVMPNSKARYRLRVFGNLPLGNREILFDEQGKNAGAGIFLAGVCKPSWACEIDL